MTKITLNDTGMDMFVKMSEGNPGALTALMELSKLTPEIDPQSAFGPYSALLSLDSYGIYGANIYIIWNDKCNRDSHKMILLLRAVQLGLFSENELKALGNDHSYKLNISNEKWVELNNKVSEKLEDFIPIKL